jgi:large subunit ribosomal protein L18
MRRPKRLKLLHRRRREGKTDYRLRLKLLKSNKPRLIIRASLNNLTCQIVKYDPRGDIILASSDSKELKKFGWNASTGNIPSAYLTGLLCGARCKDKKVNECVLDIGLYPSIRGSRIYSALKGFVDADINVPHSESIFPSNERISGKHISQFAEKLKKDDATKYKKVFSRYLKNKSAPEDITKNFEMTKKMILNSEKQISAKPKKPAKIKKEGGK